MRDAPATARRPPWLVKRLPAHADSPVPGLLDDLKLATVCRSAKCPNLSECWARKTATLMILGTHCTRSCRFCAVGGKTHEQGYTGYSGSKKPGGPDASCPSCASLLKKPSGFAPLNPPDLDEPARVAEAAKRLGLAFVVVTSVTRDDLPDGGAAHFAATVRAVHDAGAEVELLDQDRSPASPAPSQPFSGHEGRVGRLQRSRTVLIEVLVPDFQGDRDAVRAVIDAGPEAFGHNVETVPRLYRAVRPGADYGRSLAVLEEAARFGEAVSRAPARPVVPARTVVKSGLMLGLGETRGEVERVLRDLRSAGCEVVTLGQYLRPSPAHAPVAEYVTPGRFEDYASTARDLGFAAVAAGPFVRSSYGAAELWREAVASRGRAAK